MEATRDINGKTSNERALMHVLYAMHTVAWLSVGMLAVVALIANYVLRGQERNVLYQSHHRYMITTFWWTLFWLALTSPLWIVLVLPGALAWFVVGLWYLYRCLRGWLLFTRNQGAYTVFPSLEAQP